MDGTLPTAPVNPSELNNLDAVLAAFPFLRWKTHTGPDGQGRTAFAILSGNKETGEIWVLAVIEGTNAPEHEHLDGGPYGELIWTLAGELEDVADDGTPVRLGPGSVIVHKGGSAHSPRATFWFGGYHQPRGSRLVTK